VMTPMNQNIVIHWLPWLSSFSSTGFTITGRTTTSVAQITGNLFSYYCI
jgi:hypothetical protein